MCRNIRLLHHFEPPTTDEEIAAAALQYVRKVSGIQKPSIQDQASFDAAVLAVAGTTRHLLSKLSARGQARTREGEREKAQRRWKQRESRMAVK
jgi:hypothetical protein